MKNPCENCFNKQEDTYGLLCDLSCGKHSMYINYQAGIKEVVDWVDKQKGYYPDSDYFNILVYDWQVKVKEWGL